MMVSLPLASLRWISARRADVNHAPPRTIGLDDARAAVDDAGGGEIRPGYMLEQRIDANLGIFQQGDGAIDHFAEIVRRDIGRHAHGDSRRAIDQQIRDPRRQHVGNLFGVVVIGREIDGFLVEVGEQFLGDAGHADFGVAHGGGLVAVHRTEIALAVHQRVAQGKILRHAHHGVVDGAFTVGMVFADYIANHAGGFFIGFVVVVGQHAHGEQDAAVHRFQAIAHVRQRPAHDHTHGVREIGLAHLGFQRYG